MSKLWFRSTFVVTNSRLNGLLSLELQETIDFSKLTKHTRNKLIRALRHGICPASRHPGNSKIGAAYNAICGYYKIPQAYLSRTQTLCIYEPNHDLYDGVNTAHLLCAISPDKLHLRHNAIWGHRVRIPIKVLSTLIKMHRPIDEELIEKAVYTVEKGKRLTFKYKTVKM